MSAPPEGLTQEQWDLVIRYRDEWIGIGLSTEPADEATAEAAISEMYSLLDPPRAKPTFLWLDSPNEAHLLMAMMYGLGSDEGTKRPPIRDQMNEVIALLSRLPYRNGGPIPPNVAAITIAKMLLSEDMPLGPLRRAPIELALLSLAETDGAHYGTLEALISSLPVLRRNVSTFAHAEAYGKALAEWLHKVISDNYTHALKMNKFWGQSEAYWIGHYLTLRDTGLVTYDAAHAHSLDLWAAVAKSAGWWWPFEDLCIISRRPTVMAMEVFSTTGDVDRRRMHAEGGPAIKYADGWEMYAWHGTRVPKGAIMGTWTVQDILNESNQEVRRCAIEVMGWDQFIAQGKFRLVSSETDPANEGYTLDLYEVPSGLLNFDARVLLCVNATVERDGTRRRFGLTVPPEINEAVAAAAWTFNLTRETYIQLQHAY